MIHIGVRGNTELGRMRRGDRRGYVKVGRELLQQAKGNIAE